MAVSRLSSAVPLRAVLALALLLSAPAGAAVRVYGSVGLPVDAEGFELSLDIAHAERDVSVGDRDAELRDDRIGIVLTDYRRPWLQPGLRGGYLTADIDRGAADGIGFTGYYLGAQLRSELWVERSLGAQLAASYTYHVSNGDEGEQEAELRWYSAALQLAAVWRLPQIHWLIGGYLRSVEGELELDGAVEDDADFEQASAVGVVGGFDFLPDPGARVSLRLTGGAEQRIRVAFARQF